MNWLADPSAWVALVTLTALELVLGIDNIIFISILAGKLQLEQRERARRVGLLLAMLMRIGLLLSLSWIVRLTSPLFSVIGNEISGRDLILILGGLFLIAKATLEIHQKLEGSESEISVQARPTFRSVIVQIMLLDMVFSLDSVITAVGMAQQVGVMVCAVVLSVALMLFVAKPISEFVDQHPTLKVLALSFLLLIGTALVADGFEQHVPKGYLYSAMGFSVFVESLNLRLGRKAPAPVQLHERIVEHGSR